MWMDPDWEQMLKESELIALVEVTEGGKFIAKVQPKEIFKGSATTQFYIAGYYDQHLSAKEATKKVLKNKELHYVFLRQEHDPEELEFLGEEARATGNTELQRQLKEAEGQPVRFVWTPSSGDLLVKGKRVHYSLLRTSYPHSSPARDRAAFERFLKGAITFQVEGKADVALTGETLKEVRTESEKLRDSPDEQNQLAHSVASYFLLGGRTYDDAFEKIATGRNDYARLMVARLLAAIHDDRASKLLLRMLEDKNSVIQGEVVRQLAKGGAEQIGPVLLAHLAAAKKEGVYPRGIMDPVRNELAGGKIEIIRAVGELKYQPAAPTLIRLVEGVEDEYFLRVLLEALDKMGNRDYPRALEKPLSRGKLIFEIAEWTRDHHLTELKDAFERLLDNPPQGTRGIDLSLASEALGAIGDAGSAAKLTVHLEKLSARKTPNPEFFDTDQQVAMQLIGALASLHYAPARDAVEGSFFYWFGIDSAFATKPELLKTKVQLERDLEGEARKHLDQFQRVESKALVFLDNRAALVNGSETEPRYRFALEINIRSREHPEQKAESLRDRLLKAFATRDGTVGVTRWKTISYAESSGRNDARVQIGRDDVSYLRHYSQFVQATRDPKDLRFVKFLLDSGLAETWHAKDALEKSLGSAPVE